MTERPTRHPVFGRGTLEFIKPSNRKILAFTRNHESEMVLCLYNLSRSSQPVKLDLARYARLTPVDIQYQVRFPVTGEEPYRLALNEYGFFWFLLKKEMLD